MPGLRAVAGCLLAAFLPACSGLFGAEAVTESAHAVFLTQADCPYVVTNQTRDQFAVLTARGTYAPRQGDLLVGNLRRGEVRLAIVPFGEEAIARSATFEVAGYSLALAEAQDLYYGFCPLPPAAVPPGTPGLPLAPDAPQDEVPPDTSDVF
jgi:hypothetical protein